MKSDQSENMLDSGYAYLPTNETINGTTWQNPYGVSAPEGHYQSGWCLFVELFPTFLYFYIYF